MSLPRWKRVVFSLLLLLVVVAMVETLSKIVGSAVLGRAFSRPRLQARRDALATSEGRVTGAANVGWMQDEMLHPYLGFIPSVRPGHGADFAAAAPGAVHRRGPDRIVVAVVGGSFAQFFAEKGMPHLAARLGDLPAFRGKQIDVVHLATGGYKEPQQLMTIAYMLALGAEFDLVLNIDGFNDVVMYPTENARAGVFPAYPRRWHQRVEGVLHGGALRIMLARVALEQRRAALARTFRAFPLRVSYTADLVYALMDGRLERQTVETDRRLLEEEQRTLPLVATGPPLTFPSDEAMFAHLAGVWSRSSRAIHGLGAVHGFRYYHFLQPNQYLSESKTMSAVERETAWNAGSPYRRAVDPGYRALRAAARALTDAGVRFTDLSPVFADHPEPLYNDSCCHVNDRGNAIVADRIFEAIRRDLDGAPRPTR